MALTVQPTPDQPQESTVTSHPSFGEVSTGGTKARRFCTACGIAESVAGNYPCEPTNRAAIEDRVPAADRVDPVTATANPNPKIVPLGQHTRYTVRLTVSQRRSGVDGTPAAVKAAVALVRSIEHGRGAVSGTVRTRWTSSTAATVTLDVWGWYDGRDPDPEPVDDDSAEDLTTLDLLWSELPDALTAGPPDNWDGDPECWTEDGQPTVPPDALTAEPPEAPTFTGSHGFGLCPCPCHGIPGTGPHCATCTLEAARVDRPEAYAATDRRSPACLAGTCIHRAHDPYGLHKPEPVAAVEALNSLAAALGYDDPRLVALRDVVDPLPCDPGCTAPGPHHPENPVSVHCPTDATLLLIDSADQGVCPSGHTCFLTSTGGTSATFRRACVAGEYTDALPLLAEGVTLLDVTYAERLGAEPVIVEWARSFIADREPTDPGPTEPVVDPAAIWTEDDAHALLLDLLDASGQKATDDTRAVVRWIVSSHHLWPIAAPTHVVSIRDRHRVSIVPAARTLAASLALEAEVYDFNFTCVLVEAAAAERATLRAIVDRAREARTR
jgi:hypothetical protein